MEAYPPQYVEHNLPFMVISGLGDGSLSDGAAASGTRLESGTRITAQLPECRSERAGRLLQQLLKLDGTDRAWNASSLPGPSSSLRYRLKAVGRSYTLPPRKAAPMPQSPSEDFPKRQNSIAQTTELHSPLSPLSPGSRIFPDGVFTPQWWTKHQELVPALMLSFFDIKAGEGAAQDDQLKADINSIRTALGRSGFKTRFAVVLMSDRSILHAPELEERLTGIRRSTTLDPKTGLFFMPPMSSDGEIATFVQGVVAILQPLCVEYYRELTKHARRKKARSSIPAPSAAAMRGASHALSAPGWNARYEVKLGTFAEARCEMDVAERHYSHAIDDLFGSEGIFEATPSWSPRWEEARLLADTMCIRMLRCLLWNGLATSAVQSWLDYKLRMRDLIDRRGKGSQTYGWQAWEARWAEIMAQLIQRADLAVFKSSMKQSVEESSELATLRIYAMPEKAFQSADRLPPFLLLHHPGYWYRLAAQSARSRREKALAIPEENRIPSSQLPASTVASRMQNYDLYLVPEPHEEYALPDREGVDHLAEIRRLSYEASRELASRGQTRLSERTTLDLARDYASAGRFTEASDILVPLWQETSWRDEDWHSLFGEVLVLMRHCAQGAKDYVLLLATTWELLKRNLPGSRELDLTASLKQVGTEGAEKPSLSFVNRQRLSPLSVHFAFNRKEGNVGDPLECQLTLHSQAKPGTAPITISELYLAIASLQPIQITHSGDAEPVAFAHLPLTVQETFISGGANLTLRPSEQRVFSFPLTFREARVARLSELKLLVETDRYRIEHIMTDERLLSSPAWYYNVQAGLKQQNLYQGDTTTMTILPKPPKVQLILHDSRTQYYLGERIRFSIEIINSETEKVKGTLSKKALTQENGVLHSRWLQLNESENDQEQTEKEDDAQDLRDIEPSASHKLDICIQSPAEPTTCSLTVDVSYTLASEANVPLRKTVVLELPFVAPFQAKFNFGPLHNLDPWPSYFDPAAGNSEAEPSGIPQRWRLGAQIASMAIDKVIINGAKVLTDRIANDAFGKIMDEKNIEALPINPNGKFDKSFQMVTQKWSLDDRRSTIMDVSLAISWGLESGSPMFTTKLPMPRLTIPSSEPRVLCTVSETVTTGAGTVLQYHLENPSTHFLTFALTMEASEDFAFSGPKYRTMSLAPLSRHKVEFRIMLHSEDDVAVNGEQNGQWIFPVLQVVDSYYQKTLRVQAAGPGVKVDPQRGITVWIPSN